MTFLEAAYEILKQSSQPLQHIRSQGYIGRLKTGIESRSGETAP
jgi:hypothetical protein